jgi:uncharacterized OB-fold protein
MGVPNFPPALEGSHFEPFYEGLAAGELRVTADAETGEIVWYPPEVVPGRPEAKLVWRPVSSEGKAYTFTTIVRSLLPGDHKAEVPYTVVLFEPDNAPGVRVPGLLVNAEGIEPQCEMRLQLSPVRVGNHIIAGFEPA